MREIKFRAKCKNCVDRGVWVVGDLIHYYDNDIRILEQNQREWDIEEGAYKIYSETIGQYIDRIDKNKKEIYEGDVVEFDVGNLRGQIGVVRYENGVLVFGEREASFCKNVQVIGNIYDNPELLKNKGGQNAR